MVPAYPLLSLNIGKVQTSTYKGKEAQSAIGKSKVDHVVTLTELGFTGDEQADLVNHGGADKAICVYSHDHYAHWEAVLHRSLSYGAFGENFTVGSMEEQQVHIGDIYQVGSAIVQISQPRQPCWKLAMKWGLDELPLLVTNSGATGFYYRVLETGEVRGGDDLKLVRTHSSRITVAEANRVMHKDKEDVEGIRRLLAVPELSASWVNSLSKRLERLERANMEK
ncbi:MOSC domain-containing protein [Cohnella cholangitidis]|uniref:MOSC domain-containing protein n=1 Tax=Cohnella cholangitidis TaxID=2598458 RepID=A0A7G5C7N8_9BACL|nr:MOSC domain-containing protein [Cohnella cholangitidis]QMV45222.1 MOSC domain-containing protein [Cohnella cholangitidis]